ncbi:MAG: S26 family signal peptidase [Candidatus Margulisbacteria bacterium]|nr:S26 family signal peptidase [Candidatus Margulisiibacteriota bacterium]
MSDYNERSFDGRYFGVVLGEETIHQEVWVL